MVSNNILNIPKLPQYWSQNELSYLNEQFISHISRKIPPGFCLNSDAYGTLKQNYVEIGISLYSIECCNSSPVHV